MKINGFSKMALNTTKNYLKKVHFQGIWASHVSGSNITNFEWGFNKKTRVWKQLKSLRMIEKWMATLPSAASRRKLSHVSPEIWSTGLMHVCSIFCRHSFSFVFLEKITYCSIYIVMWDFTLINTWFYGVQFILHLQFSYFSFYYLHFTFPPPYITIHM